MKPRILIYDIETAPAIGLFFGKPYEVNIAKIIQQEYVFGFAWQWLGEKKIHTCYIWDFFRYTKDPTNSIEVIKKWAELVKEADIIVGHNSDQFDYRQMHGRIVQFKLPPIPKPQQVDTKKLAKRLGYYESNKLDDLSKRFGHGGKLDHEGIELWWKCMNGEKKAQKHMVAYNKVDVEKTRQLYQDFMPYDERHPNMANIAGRPESCPRCGGEKGFLAQGFRMTKTARYRRWQCKACGSYVSERNAEKGERIKYV